MTLYWFLLVLSIGGGLAAERLKGPWRKIYLPLMGAVFWLVAALRYQTGFDYRFYETLFETVSSTPLSGLFGLEHTEPGFLLLLKLGGLTGSYRGFLLLFHLLLTLLVFCWIARWSERRWLSVTLFLCLQFFALSMNFLRQSLAAAVLLYAYRFLRENRFPPYLGLVLLGACFHRTALVMLPLYLFLRIPASKRHYLLAGLAAAVLYFTMDPLIDLAVRLFPHYSIYLDSKYWTGNSFRYLLPPLGVLLLSLPLVRRRSPGDEILFNTVFYCFLIQCFITKHFILERFSIYLSGFALLALPAAVGAARRRGLWTILVLVLALGYLLFAANDGFHAVYPYRGLWDRALR